MYTENQVTLAKIFSSQFIDKYNKQFLTSSAILQVGGRVGGEVGEPLQTARL